jgi:hypothetical protein
MACHSAPTSQPPEGSGRPPAEQPEVESRRSGVRGVQWWFFSNYGECFAGGVKVETPEEFAAYDPKLNELIARVFTTHRIPMDVFHAKRIRPVTC